MKQTEVAVYYFPNYHPDPLNEQWHGQGWTEWELVKAARPRFQGHDQPKIPMWGYEDESDPAIMAKKIQAAADHGISSFIFDWYWYENAPFLQGALERGFLHAVNSQDLKFSLMWANHDWYDIQPAPRNFRSNLAASGKVTEEQFIAATDYMIAHYFHQPNYWKVEGGLYFSIYELMNLIEGLGGSYTETKRILEDFRTRVRNAGLGELHLNAIVWGVQNLPGEKAIEDVNKVLDDLGFDSITSYVWIHHNAIPHFPMSDYGMYRELSVKDFERFTNEYDLPYFPNVSMGWDSSPRTVQTDVFDCVGYPYTPILVGNTPEQFEKALREAKTFLDKGATERSILTVNSWNEWTEGSYLEPDTRYGMKYLEAIRDVFGVKRMVGTQTEVG
ncbi:hypothetical protein GC096_11100 [Paenibacillus sp. LMG 31461]|uniref:Glycosyltransferase WbsX n=1 Tax=Paenibacillus plantarum TaxID=2654975 RepID=A0ABX1X8D0_9BACL|nr:glycoside hydrolase family 99-like domain-containing protein [Paenibacillus plantarum]NOU64577.1 hypothetical protein [Paenibacillus plantarum]